MIKDKVTKPEIKLVGLSVRTNNMNEIEPITAKIGGLASKFQNQNIASQISNRKNPGVTYAVYTEYDSDEHGDYTYFIGEEVSAFENVPLGCKQITIPDSQYQKFTVGPDKMPMVVIQAWQQIWKMTSEDLGGQRTYQADFEVYDQRATDPVNTILDIFIGVK